MLLLNKDNRKLINNNNHNCEENDERLYANAYSFLLDFYA